MRELFADDGQSISIPTFILRLIRSVRDGEAGTAKEVYSSAKSRRRRLGLMSFSTGPMIPVATELTELYCETATVVDLVELHRLGLTDEEIGAHLLMLWELAGTYEEALRVIGDGSGAEMAAVLHQRYGVHDLPPVETKLDIVKRLWKLHKHANKIRGEVGDGAIKGVLFTGKRTKQFIREAEQQLRIGI